MKLILFDIDGTVLDAGGSGRWAMTRAFEDVFGIPDAEPFTRQVRFDGLTDPQILRMIAANASVSDQQLEARRARIQSAFLDHLGRRLAGSSAKRALPGVVDLLERLAGVRMAAVGLATGNIEAGARLKLASVGLSEYFETGGFGGDAPDRAGIGRVAVKRFEEKLATAIPASDVIAVGDAVEDVKAARANGFACLAVGTGWVGHDALKAAGPDLFLEDLSDYGAAMRFIFGSRG